jgi:hypothetical protein
MTLERLLKRVQGRNVQPKKSDKIKPKNEASAESLRKGLDTQLLKRNKKIHKQISEFHPSTHQTCKRWYYLMFEGAESQPKFSARTLRIFDNGHDIHSRYRDYFTTMGILLDSEIPVYIETPAPIKGSADGLLEWGGKKLYELKSINPERFEFRKVYKKPDEKTYKQIQLYLYALDLEDGFVIYENKGNQEVLIYSVSRDDELIKKELRRFNNIYKIFENKNCPKRPYIRESTQCSECDLESWCWAMVDN